MEPPAWRVRFLPWLALLASLLATLALPSQAAPVKKPDPLPSPVHLKACVFDPMGSGGKVIDVARELATNPFLRADDPVLAARWGGGDAVATFAALRAAKDTF